MLIETTDPCFPEKNKALHALYTVMDPELSVNVVDLGLIYAIQFEEENKIQLTMTLSTPHCPLGDTIRSGVTRALIAVFPEHSIQVDIVFDPPWSPDRLTEEGRKQLYM